MKKFTRLRAVALSALLLVQLWLPVAAFAAETGAEPGQNPASSASAAVSASPAGQEGSSSLGTAPVQPGSGAGASSASSSPGASSESGPGSSQSGPGTSSGAPAQSPPPAESVAGASSGPGAASDAVPSSSPAEAEEPPADALAREAAPAAGGQDIKTYFAAGQTPTIVSSADVTYADSRGNAVTDPTIDSLINFNFGLNIPADVAAQVNAGDYYDIQLPTNVTIEHGVTNVELYDATGRLYAHFSVDADGIVRIVFTDQVKDSGGLEGELYFQGNFNKGEITRPGDVDLNFPTESNINVSLNLKPQTSNSIDKKGSAASSQNPSQINWDIDFNKTLNTLNNTALAEDFPATLSVDSLTVYRLNIGLYGEVEPVTDADIVPEDSGVYTANGDGSVSFPGQITGAYRLRYVTNIDQSAVPTRGGSLAFPNTVSLTSAENTQPLTATATVVASFSRLVEKVNTGYDAATQTFTWLIRYNYGRSSEASAALSDIFWDGNADTPIEYVDGSLQVHEVSFTANGTPVRGDTPLPEAGNYSLDSTGDPTRFDLTFEAPRPAGTAYDIVYQTRVPPNFVVADDFNMENSVILGGLIPPDGPAHSTAQVRQQLISKRLVRADVDTKQLYYEIDINGNQNTLYGLTLVDTLTGGQKVPVVGGVPQIEVTNLTTGQPIPPGAYTVASAGNNTDPTQPQLLTFFFTDSAYLPLTQHIRISYMADYNAVLNPEGTVMTNDAALAWQDEENGPVQERRGVVDYRPLPQDENDGDKFGSYNAVTKEITWAVLVDYAAIGLRNATVTDPILSNQVFVPASVRIFEYSIDPTSGIATRGTEIPQDEYALTTINEPTGTENTLTVRFPDQPANPTGESKRYWVEYRTSLVNQLVYANYDNVATLQNDLSSPRRLEGEATVTHGSNLVEKSGNQGTDGYAHWRVLLNPSQSYIQDLTLIDTPSANQNILEDTIAVYPGVVDTAGDITPDMSAPLQQGQDYTFTYAQDGGVWRLTLVLDADLFPSQNTYVVDYRAALLVESSEEAVTNSAQIVSTGTGTLNNTTNGNINIVTTNAGGILVGRRTSFSIQKTGEGGAPLEGVQLQLFDARGNPVGGARTTSADGTIAWDNLVAGNYTLRELSTLAGYYIPDELRTGAPYAVSAPPATAPVEVRNELARIVVTKAGRNGAAVTPLSGGLFRLEQYDEEADTWSAVGGADRPAGTDGTITYEGLPAGQYRVVEMQAPAGYIRRTDPLVFTVGSGGVLPAVTPVAFYNYQGEATLRKFANFEDPALGTVPHYLAGATFRLQNDVDTPLYDETLTTDGDGRLTFTGLAPGNYLVTESAAPEGFNLLDGAVIPVTIGANAADGQITYDIGEVENTPWDGGFVTFAKVRQNAATPAEEDDLLAGAVFEVRRVADENGALIDPPEVVRTGLTTGENGIAGTAGLADGGYELVETTAPAGYVRNLDPVPFEVDTPAGGGATYITLDDPVVNYLGSAGLQKQDADGAALPGALFTLTHLSGGESGEDLVLGTGYASEADGSLLIEGLAPGNYTLQENTPPEGYVRNTKTLPFAIAAEANGAPTTVQLGTLTNYLASASVRKADEDGNPLPGVSFTLERTDSATQPAETAYTTGPDGTIVMAGLSPGQYSLTEDAAPEGYLLNTQPLTFTVGAEALDEPEPLALGDFLNYKGSILVQKQDERGTPLAGATFSLAFVDADGETELAGEYTTDVNGQILLEGLQPGTFELWETAPPTGFLFDPTVYTATVPAEAAGAPAPVEVTVTNRRYLGALDITKTDEAGAPLAGAMFELRGEDGGVVRSGIISATGGTAVVSGLAPGVYTLVETQAPSGYIAGGTQYRIEIDYEPVEESEVVQYNAAVAVVNKKAPPPPASQPPTGGAATGDTFSLALWVAVTVAAVGGLALVLVLRARRRGGTYPK